MNEIALVLVDGLQFARDVILRCCSLDSSPCSVSVAARLSKILLLAERIPAEAWFLSPGGLGPGVRP